MPLFYQQTINSTTRLAIWKIEEDETYFSASVPLQATITHPHKRLQHLAGRYLLRYLFPSFPYNEIVIASTKKPYLPNEEFHFSISHCDDFAAAIVSTKERVGIDIETISPKIAKIIHKFLSPHEREFFKLAITDEISNAHYLKDATLLWSAKEALFKWWANGNVDFKSMLQIQESSIGEVGSLNCQINLQQSTIPLNVNYNFFDKLTLAFVISYGLKRLS